MWLNLKTFHAKIFLFHIRKNAQLMSMKTTLLSLHIFSSFICHFSLLYQITIKEPSQSRKADYVSMKLEFINYLKSSDTILPSICMNLSSTVYCFNIKLGFEELWKLLCRCISINVLNIIFKYAFKYIIVWHFYEN